MAHDAAVATGLNALLGAADDLDQSSQVGRILAKILAMMIATRALKTVVWPPLGGWSR